MSRTRRLVTALAAILAFAGCSDKATEQFNDAPKLNNVDTAAVRLSFPDGFSSVAAKCFGTDMVYSAFNANGRAVAVSANHPWCQDFVLTEDEQQR
jgi:PBP1b-binding outer membrane lipoprotein LpoB